MQKAITTSSGWAIIGGCISTLYFGLRSDKKVAEKYNLDIEKDQKFIKNIKNKQMLWTLPSLAPGIGMATGIASWLYNKTKNPDIINVE